MPNLGLLVNSIDKFVFRWQIEYFLDNFFTYFCLISVLLPVYLHRAGLRLAFDSISIPGEKSER